MTQCRQFFDNASCPWSNFGLLLSLSTIRHGGGSELYDALSTATMYAPIEFDEKKARPCCHALPVSASCTFSRHFYNFFIWINLFLTSSATSTCYCLTTPTTYFFMLIQLPSIDFHLVNCCCISPLLVMLVL